MPYLPSNFYQRYLTAFSLAALPLAVMAEVQSTESNTLETVTVIADRYDDEQPGAEYLDGQISTGGRVGVLGQMDGYDAPFNLIRYNKEMLDDEQVDSISDISDFDAGVVSFSGPGNYSEQFQIRGFPLFGDDIAYGGLYGVVPRQVVLTDVAESIEVLKGASAFANGVSPASTGVGGSINLEPKYAGEDDLTEVGLSYQNNSYVSANFDSGRRFGDDDQLGLRLSGLFGQGGTSVEDEKRRNASIYLGLDYETDSSHSYLNAGYQRSDVDEGRSTVTLDTNLDKLPDAPDSETNYKTDWTYFDADNYFGIVRHETRVTDHWSVYAAGGANRTDEIGAYSAPTLTNSDGSATISRMDVAFISQTMTGQLGVEGSFDTAGINHIVNVGYSGYVKEEGTTFAFGAGSQNTNIFDPAELSPIAEPDLDDPELTTKTQSHGVAISDSMDIAGGAYQVIAGLRYQYIETSGGSEYDGDALSPVVGLSYHPVDPITLYANYVESLQQGTTAGAGSNNEGEKIGLARSNQIEAGAKMESDSVGATVSLYRIVTPSAYTNADGDYGYHGEQRNYGAEINVFGDLFNRLHLLTSVAVTDALGYIPAST